MIRRARSVLFALLLLAMSAFAGAKDIWLIEAGRLTRVDVGAGTMQSAPISEFVRKVAPIGNGGAWALTDTALTLLDDAFVPQASMQMMFGEAAMVGPIVADPEEGGVWLGIGASLVYFDRTGARVRQLSMDAPVLAMAVAGPDATFVATATTLMRLDSTGAAVARIDLANLPGTGSAMALMDPVAGYLWLVRAGAVIQFDALLGMAPRATIVVPCPDAASLDSQSGVLTLISGQEVLRYDRNAAAIRPGVFTSEMLADIAGIESQARNPMLWFGDRIGLGAIELLGGLVSRVPGRQGVDRFAADPLHFEQHLDMDVAGVLPSDPSTQVSLRFRTYCDGFVCAASPAYLKALRVRSMRDGDGVGSLFSADINHDAFSGRIPVAPWQFASLEAWVIDAYGNRSNVVGRHAADRAPKISIVKSRP